VRPDLDAAVDFVRRAVTLGLAVRNAAGVRVRQPLARAVVRAPAPMLAWLPAFASDLADELNVETVEQAAVDGGAPAEPAGEASLRAATAGDVTVALDLALTEGLRRKGLVRQLVHQVQLLRKSAGLEVDDRIRLVVTAGAESRDAFEEHRAYICAETLALEMSFEAPSPGFVSRDARLDGGAVTLALARAARAEPAP
jgi:isoleucyl-tRNA synthetase